MPSAMCRPSETSSSAESLTQAPVGLAEHLLGVAEPRSHRPFGRRLRERFGGCRRKRSCGCRPSRRSWLAASRDSGGQPEWAARVEPQCPAVDRLGRNVRPRRRYLSPIVLSIGTPSCHNCRMQLPGGRRLRSATERRGLDWPSALCLGASCEPRDREHGLGRCASRRWRSCVTTNPSRARGRSKPTSSDRLRLWPGPGASNADGADDITAEGDRNMARALIAAPRANLARLSK